MFESPVVEQELLVLDVPQRHQSEAPRSAASYLRRRNPARAFHFAGFMRQARQIRAYPALLVCRENTERLRAECSEQYVYVSIRSLGWKLQVRVGDDLCTPSF